MAQLPECWSSRPKPWEEEEGESEVLDHLLCNKFDSSLGYMRLRLQKNDTQETSNLSEVT